MILSKSGFFCGNFYPRPPGGGRLDFGKSVKVQRVFLSTPSGWRATGDANYYEYSPEISIHALRVEGDQILG